MFSILDAKTSQNARKGGLKRYKNLKKELGSKEAISRYFSRLARKRKK